MFKKKRVKKIIGITLALSLLFTLSANIAFAQGDGPITDNIIIQIDTIWLFIGSFLVFWMQAGFAMVESGFSRSKNAANLLMKNLMDFCMGAMLFFAVGFGIMYGSSAGGVIGSSNFFLSDLGISADNAYGWVDFLFQLMFAAAAATIVSGAVAERLEIQHVFNLQRPANRANLSNFWTLALRGRLVGRTRFHRLCRFNIGSCIGWILWISGSISAWATHW